MKILNYSYLVFFYFFLSGCAVPMSKIYVDNSSCTRSISKGMHQILSSKLDKTELQNLDITQEDIEKMFKKTGIIEIEGAYVKHNDVTYNFLFQEDGNTCWIRLYEIIKEKTHYYNTITFMGSFKLDLCKCGGTTTEISI